MIYYCERENRMLNISCQIQYNKTYKITAASRQATTTILNRKHLKYTRLRRTFNLQPLDKYTNILLFIRVVTWFCYLDRLLADADVFFVYIYQYMYDVYDNNK